MALEPGIASFVYIITIIGFILTLVILAFSMSVLLQASLRKLPARILLHMNTPPPPSPSSTLSKNSEPRIDFRGGSSQIFVSPYDGIIH